MEYKSRYYRPAMPLSLVDAVRKRPGMYVGDTDDGSGLHHLVWEILANSIDEAVAGHATGIGIKLHSDGSITITDDGRGIPVHKVNDAPFPEVIVTEFHTSATADGHSPHVHVAMNGIGIGPVSAVSEWLELETRRDGRINVLRTERGVLVQRLQDLGPSSKTGTSIRFRPDSEIFGPINFSPEKIEERLVEQTALSPGLKVTLTTSGGARTFHAPEGLSSLLDREADYQTASGDHGRFSFEVVWHWQASEPQVDAFTNWQRVGTEGSHIRGLLSGLSASGRSTTAGEHLHAVIHVRTSDPSMIYGPMKNELRDDKLEAAIHEAVQKTISN